MDPEVRPGFPHTNQTVPRYSTRPFSGVTRSKSRTSLPEPLARPPLEDKSDGNVDVTIRGPSDPSRLLFGSLNMPCGVELCCYFDPSNYGIFSLQYSNLQYFERWRHQYFKIGSLVSFVWSHVPRGTALWQM